MSGGAFNYLSSKDAAGLCQSREDLHAMLEELKALAASEFEGATEAVDQTREIMEQVLMLEELMTRINSWTDGTLGSVWHAVEWWRSGDYGEDQVHEALAKLGRQSPRSAV